MDNDFKTLYNTLRAEQDALKAKMQSARGDAHQTCAGIDRRLSNSEP